MYTLLLKDGRRFSLKDLDGQRIMNAWQRKQSPIVLFGEGIPSSEIKNVAPDEKPQAENLFDIFNEKPLTKTQWAEKISQAKLKTEDLKNADRKSFFADQQRIAYGNYPKAKQDAAIQKMVDFAIQDNAWWGNLSAGTRVGTFLGWSPTDFSQYGTHALECRCHWCETGVCNKAAYQDWLSKRK